MTDSLNLTDLEAVQAYIREESPVLLQKLFYGFPTAQAVNPMEGVKGKVRLTKLVVDKLVRRFGKDFLVYGDTHRFSPLELEVHNAKVDLRIYPEDMEHNYAGRLRQKGRNGNMEIVWQAELFDNSFKSIAQQMEDAIWKAKKVAVPAATDYLENMFDGYLEILKANGGALAPVTTGPLTETNAFTEIQQVYKRVDKKFKAAGTTLWISPNTAWLAGVEYANKFTKYAGTNGTGFYLADNVTVQICPGIPDSVVIFSPAENLYYGYDSAMDHTMFNTEQEDRSLKFWMDFNMGTQWGFIDSEFITLNDQALL